MVNRYTEESELEMLAFVFGCGISTSGSVVVRTSTGSLSDDPGPETETELRGYRLGDGEWFQLSEAALFAVYCTDADTGEALAPEYGVRYVGVEQDTRED